MKVNFSTNRNNQQQFKGIGSVKIAEKTQEGLNRFFEKAKVDYMLSSNSDTYNIPQNEVRTAEGAVKSFINDLMNLKDGTFTSKFAESFKELREKALNSKDNFDFELVDLRKVDAEQLPKGVYLDFANKINSPDAKEFNYLAIKTTRNPDAPDASMREKFTPIFGVVKGRDEKTTFDEVIPNTFAALLEKLK